MTKQEICKMLNAGRNRGMLEALVEMGIIALVEDANGRVVPALRVVVHAEETVCPPPPEPPCNAIINSLASAEGGGVEVDISGTIGTHVSVSYNYNDGENEDTLACTPNTGVLNLGDAAMFLTEPNPTLYTINVSNDECETICDSVSFTNFPFTVLVPVGGEDTVFTPTGLPACGGIVVFTQFFDNGEVADIELDEDGTLTIPAQTIATSGLFAYYMTCDGVLVASIIVSIVNEPLGLRLTFDDIANAPVVDPSNIGQWNSFFDLPTNGTPFTSVIVDLDEVTLFGGENIIVAATLFTSNNNLISCNDDSGCLIEVEYTGFANAENLVSFTSNSVTSMGLNGAGGAFRDCYNMVDFETQNLTNLEGGIGSDGAFSNNSSNQSFVFPNLITVPNYAFRNCVSATTFDLTSCTSLGANPADASVFDGITGNTIAISIPAVHQTNNGGNMHASLAYLDANNTVTFTWI